MKPIYLILMLSFLLSSCQDEKIFFVADHFGNCEDQCLLVRENENDDWVNFSNAIEGFKYEEGYSYKLKIKVEKLDNSITIDKSNFKYTLLEVLSKTKSSNFDKLKIDNEKKWVVTQINGFTNTTGKLPYFKIINGTIQGNSGCNTFGGAIQTNEEGLFKVGMLRMTKMYCIEFSELENAFTSTWNKASYYNITNDILSVFDKDKNALFTASQNVKTLADKWYISSIKGFSNATNIAPYFTINDGQISGNNGCNDFGGEITTDESGVFKPGVLRMTKKYCVELAALEKAFHATLSNAAYYKINDGVLFVLDKSKYVLMSASTSKPNIEDNTSYQPYIIEYNTYSQNFAFKNKIIENKNTLYYFELQPKKTEEKKCALSKTDLKFFKDELLKLKNTDLESLKPPSTNYKDNGAVGATLIVSFKGSTYRVPTFDHGNPPKEIRAIVEKIMELRSE